MSTTHIIIVNYNAGDWLLRSVESALKHSQGLVTVVDNDSTDNSVERVQEKYQDSRLNWHKNSRNLGFAAANNQVLQALDADYAVLMNPDCELYPDTLVAVQAAFATNPRMGLASCRILNDDGSLQLTCRRRFPTPWMALVRVFQLHRIFPANPRFANFDYGVSVDPSGEVEYVEAVSGAFMVVRKSALADVGLLDEGYFMHCEDLDWCKRFEAAGWQVGFVPAAHVMHAKGVSTASRPIRVLWTLHMGMNRFFDKFYCTEYSLPIRLLVKCGIASSFVLRAALTLVKR